MKGSNKLTVGLLLVIASMGAAQADWRTDQAIQQALQNSRLQSQQYRWGNGGGLQNQWEQRRLNSEMERQTEALRSINRTLKYNNGYRY